MVRATADSSEPKPEVRAVVRRSGNQALRLFFQKTVTKEAALDLVESLKPLAVSFESVNEFYFALDLQPEADVTRVGARLDDWEERGWVAYETCEVRVPGGFDAED